MGSKYYSLYYYLLLRPYFFRQKKIIVVASKPKQSNWPQSCKLTHRFTLDLIDHYYLYLLLLHHTYRHLIISCAITSVLCNLSTKIIQKLGRLMFAIYLSLVYGVKLWLNIVVNYCIFSKGCGLFKRFMGSERNSPHVCWCFVTLCSLLVIFTTFHELANLSPKSLILSFLLHLWLRNTLC